ncbi:MAG: hypothetical protein QM786_15155 [Breznakibacter sp.]
MSIVETDNGTKDVVFKQKTESTDSVTVYDYLLGDTFCRILKTKRLGVEMTESTTYHRNGKVMSYRLHHQSNLLYYRIYNKNGVSTKYGGNGILFEDSISHVFLERGTEYAKIIRLANPPNCKVVVMIGEYRPEELEDRDLRRYPIRMFRVSNSRVTYSVKSDSIGMQRYQIFWAVEDTISNDIQNGMMIHEFSFQH